jgi:membrane associated rhomboid family serine protease
MLQASKIKFTTMAAFWFLSGAIGNIFGALCNSNGPLTVGSQPANFALYGGIIAAFIVNWKALERVQALRVPMIVILVVIWFFLMLNSASSFNGELIKSYRWKDQFGNWGGWLAGIFLGLIMMPRLRGDPAFYVGSYEKFCAKVGAVWLVIYLAVIFSCFYTVYAPPQHTSFIA